MVIAVSVVLFHPDPASLQVTLGRLASWRHGPVLVHVNESTDVPSWVRALLPAAQITASPDNRGFSGAHNALVAAALSAGADAVLVHNPDLLLPDEAVEGLAEAAERHPGALLGPALQLAQWPELQPTGLVDTLGIVWTRSGRHLDGGQGSPWQPPSGPPREVAGISGAALWVSREVHDLLVELSGELFDEDFIAYREDAELAFRAALLGIPSLLVPEAQGLHGRSLRGTTRGGSAHVDRLGVRNRFLLAAKYGRHRPGGMWGPLARDLVVLLGVVLRERSSWSGVTDAWRLRKRMRAKGQVVLRAARLTSRQAARL